MNRLEVRLPPHAELRVVLSGAAKVLADSGAELAPLTPPKTATGDIRRVVTGEALQPIAGQGGDVCVGIVARDAKGGVSKAFVKTEAGGLYLA